MHLRHYFLLFLSFLFVGTLTAQHHLHVPLDTTVITTHQTTIQGQAIRYTAEVGYQPVWDQAGMPIASLQYTYYTRDGVNQREERPLLISFNGGPGSGSVWMHLAYTGPKTLRIDEEGYPVQPYGVQSNPYSVLDVADILFVNPANTGYSRTIPLTGSEVRRDLLFGVNADVNYLADWISTFVSRHGRWQSPKYIVGESYGGTRVMGLSLALQNRAWMYLNGVIMVSPADYKIIREDDPLGASLYFPYMAATAWHHKVLADVYQNKDLTDYLPEVEDFTINTLIPALAKGGYLPAAERQAIAKTMADYCGLSEQEILDHNLRVPNRYFWKALLRERGGFNVGRLDSRYLGIDQQLAGTRPDYSAELTSWLHSFTPAINHYYRSELNFATDLRYNMFGPVRPWDFEDDDTRENLRQAMAQNPYLHVLVQSGYYDGATTYFQAKHTMAQLDLSGRLTDRLSFKGYRSGHMMYLRREDLENANNDLRQFIQATMTKGEPAKYERDE
ncbi:MAG: carboxypeptidase [Bacteroidota bacterium]